MADPETKSQAGDAKEGKMSDEKVSTPDEPVVLNEPGSPPADNTPQLAPAVPVPLEITDTQPTGIEAPNSPDDENQAAKELTVAGDEVKMNQQSQENSSVPPLNVVDAATPPNSNPPPVIILIEKDSAGGVVAPASSASIEEAPPRAPSSTEAGAPTSDAGKTMTTATTAPPVLQNHTRAGSDDDGLDEFIKSPHGQNAIVERSPGGRYVRFMEKLGSGASKDVYRAYDTQEGIEVAWNVVSLSGLPKADRNRIVNEVRLLERLHHHNIISFHGSWVNRERQEVHFVTEILSSGTLKSFINKVQVIRWKIAKRWAVQILKGLEYLHSQDPPVIHRDLKCENIFINGTSGDLRIGDLGLSTVHHNGRVLSVLGTPEFMAPDMYEESSYDQRVDIYAFGMCMLEIFTKEIPYKECKNPAQIYKKVSNGELPEILNRLQSKHAREFVMLCLGYKDENGEYIRPTAKELLTHDFLIKRPNDEDEVLVDPPLIKRTIAENDTMSYGNPAWPPAAPQNNAQVPKSESMVEKSQSITPAQTKPETDQGSVDGDESDRFDEMPDSEINIRKVKVLMGRGQELKEDEEPLGDTSGRSVEGSVHSHASSDRMPDPNKQALKNGVPALRAGKKVNVGPSLQVTQPGHYLVAAAVIENEDALSYPDDILKLVVTLPVDGQTQNVQFDFHLVEDDPVQVGKEMVAELGIPQGAVLEISETISGLACAARMQRDKHRLRAQQNSQGQVAPQSQHVAQTPQMGASQEVQGGIGMQQQQQQQIAVSDFANGQQLQGAQSSDQMHMQSQPIQSQMSQAPSPQTSQVSDAQATGPYNHMQTQSHGQQQQQQHQMQGQLQNQQMNHGNHAMNDSSQQQVAHFGYEQNQGNIPQQQQLHAQQMPQVASSMAVETQSLPPFAYEGVRNQTGDNQSMQSQPSVYAYDPGQRQSQGQNQAIPQHLLQQQGGDFQQQQPNSYLYDSQQTHQQPHQQNQGQLNQSMGQQAPLHSGQQTNQMPPQSSLQGQNQQPHMHQMMQPQQNGQPHGSTPLHQAPQIQGQGNQTQGQQQSFGQVSLHHLPSQDPQQRQVSVGSHGQDVQQMQQPPQQMQQHPMPQQQQQQSLQPQQHMQQQQQQQQQQHQQSLPPQQQQGVHQQQQPQSQQTVQQQQSQSTLQQQQQQPVQHQPMQQQQQQPMQQQQQQPQIQQQQSSYPSSPVQQSQQSQEPVYEHGVSLPNANSQLGGLPMGASMKRSVSTSSYVVPRAGQQPIFPTQGQAAAPVVAMDEMQSLFASEPTRLPPSRSSSGYSQNPSIFQEQPGSESFQDAELNLFALSQAARAVEQLSMEDEDEELRKLDEDFQKNLQRAKKVFDNRMDNLQRSQIEREAQHKKTLEKHQKERAEFEKRLQQEAKEQNRRIEQLQREWDRKREVLAKNKRKVSVSEDERSVSPGVSLSSSPDTGYFIPNSTVNDEAEQTLNQTMSNDSDR